MFHKPVSGLVGIALLFGCAAVAQAQDFRVYTQIFDARTPEAAATKNARPRLLGRSTSLFHAGKVYDQLDSGSQITIYEPAHEHFTIVDGPRRMLTVIPFDYIENRLFQVGKSTEKKIAELRENNTADANQLADILQFQLTPVFKEQYEEKPPLLKMGSRWLSYEVKCASHDSPDVIAAYLNFTDAMARLNYLVNEKALLPGPRLELDKVLLRRGVLPVEVYLHASHEKGLHLRAEHRFDWKLDATDRSMIHHWEKLMSARDVRKVSTEEFFEPAAPKKLDARR
jgi:hypothetical protein